MNSFSSLPCRRCRAVSPAETLLEVQPLLWGIYAHAFNITTRIGLPRNFCFLSLSRSIDYLWLNILHLVLICWHLVSLPWLIYCPKRWLKVSLRRVSSQCGSSSDLFIHYHEGKDAAFSKSLHAVSFLMRCSSLIRLPCQ